MLTPAARAGMRDQATKIIFNQSVQVPGCVLPAGSYWFVLSNVADADCDTVQIFSSDSSKLYATVETEPVERGRGPAGRRGTGRVRLPSPRDRPASLRRS